MTDEQRKTIERNMRAFMVACKIPSAILIFHGQYGEEHGLMQVNPGTCKMIDSIADTLRDAISKHNDDKPFDLNLN